MHASFRALPAASCLLAAASTLSSPLDAQQSSTEDPGAPTATVTRITTASPTIDGRLDDDAWSLGEPLTEFFQREPVEGEPVSERTEVRFLADDEALYVGAWLYDRSADGIVTGERLRDANIQVADHFGFVLDTYLDRQKRVHLHDHARGDRVRRPGGERGRGRRAHGGQQSAAEGSVGRLQPQLGRELGGRDLKGRTGVVRRVQDPVRHAPLRGGIDPDLGPEHGAPDPPPERGVVLGADTASVQPDAAVDGRSPRGCSSAGPARRHGQPLRAELGGARLRQRARCTVPQRGGDRRQDHADPIPDARPHDQHGLCPGRGRRAAHEPDALSPLLPRKASVFPGERGHLHGRYAAGRRPLLQPEDRNLAPRKRGYRSSGEVA